MFRKIICPTDFSDEAINATEYAANLAQVFKSELLLFNLQKIPLAAKVTLNGEISHDEKENTVLAIDRLKKTCEDINKTFQISATYEVDITTRSLTQILTDAQNEETMIVMGTGGLRYVHDYFFGTKTYRVIKKAKCPVLIVPENCKYAVYKNIAYAMAYEEKVKVAINPLYEFCKPFGAGITFLHVSEHDTEISKDVFRAEKEEVENFFKDKSFTLHFERIYSIIIEEAIEKFVSGNSIDLLVMAVRHRNIAELIFKRKPILSDLSSVPMVPMLIFHS